MENKIEEVFYCKEVHMGNKIEEVFYDAFWNFNAGHMIIIINIQISHKIEEVFYDAFYSDKHIYIINYMKI